MKFISLRLAAFAAIASIVCLVSTPLVHDQGSVAPDPNVVAQPASFEAQERFDALNHRKKKHHHHGKRHLHGHYHHGKNHPHHKYKLPLKPKPDPEYCPTTARDSTLGRTCLLNMTTCSYPNCDSSLCCFCTWL